MKRILLQVRQTQLQLLFFEVGKTKSGISLDATYESLKSPFY